MPFAVVLKLATQAYVTGTLDVGLVHQPKLNARTKKILELELKDIRLGKNLSPAFSNAREAIAYLKKS